MSTTNIFTGYTLPQEPRGARRRDRYRALMGEDAQRPERGERHEHRSGRRGHGHGGPGFGDEFGAGRGGGPGFGPRRGRRRASRGVVSAAVHAQLAEEPQHGYAVIGQLAERSGGLWRPSPGSIYPVLAQLEEEGLVASDVTDGRKVFSLTDTGRAYVADHADEMHEPWTPAQSRHRDRAVALFEAVRSLGNAAKEVGRNGSDAQVEQARSVLDEARRSLYRILAEEPGEATTADESGESPA
jgi:DNA-binding PadR family transcriptional regulator